MKEVTLHQHQQARLHVLNSVLAEEITIGQAAELMDLSERHARRLLAAYRELGAGALAHGNRDRRPHNAVPEAVAAAVVRLAATRYGGANHTHLTELLEEQEGIAIGRSTVRRILVRAGMPSPRRPPRALDAYGVRGVAALGALSLDGGPRSPTPWSRPWKPRPSPCPPKP